MEKELNQSEIDSMVRAARGGKAAPVVSAWDYKEAGRLNREQLASISALHEGFARSLTNSIGAFLRIGFQASLASAEHFSFRNFLGNLPERSFLGSVRLAPSGASALIQMDLALAFPLIDLLLGGEGGGEAPEREITEIEDQILETVMRIICRELQLAWHPLALEFQFQQRQQPSRVQHLLAAEEKVLGVSFEIKMKESTGLLSVALPAVFSSALLRKMSSASPRSQSQLASEDWADRLRARLQRCGFRMEAECAVKLAQAADLMTLSPGAVLVFERRADSLAQLACQGRPALNVRIARLGNRRAVQVIGTLEEKASWQQK